MTTPTISRTQLIIDWLTSLGWDTRQELGYPLVPGPYILEGPDRQVFITGTGGPGYVVEEGLPQAATFQARLRGPLDDPVTPESQMELLDAMILAAPFPANVDGVTVHHAHRLGGPPVPLPVTPDDLRHEFTCNYVFISGA